MDPDTRVLHVLLAQHLQESGMWPEALAAVEEARVPFPSDFNLQLLHARSLIHLGRPHEAAEILAATLVLPSEHARDSHRLWEQAHTLAALDAMESSHWTQAREHLLAALEWPEHLGQGRPYQPEERLARLLLGRVESNLGRDPAALEAYQAVVAGTPGLSELLAGGEWDRALTPLDLLAMLALNDLARLTRPFDPEEARQIGEKMRRVEDTWWEGEDMAPIFGELNKDLDGRMISRAMALWMDER
jgi:tetratricopeptide (TPR) repeat protein